MKTTTPKTTMTTAPEPDDITKFVTSEQEIAMTRPIHNYNSLFMTK